MKHYAFIIAVMASLCFAQTLNHVENDFIKIIVGPEGFDHPRFSIETTGGDPSRSNDDNLPLIYGRPQPWTSYTSLAIDGDVYGIGTQTLKRAGKSARYGQVIYSEVTQNSIVTTTKIDIATVTQRLSFFRNPLTNINDSVLIEYEVKNEDIISRNIGLRIMMDTMLGMNDAAPFRIGEDAVVSEKLYKGSAINDYWQSFDSLSSPNIIAQGILRYPPAGLTPPDELILMNWGDLADQPYRVTVQPGRSFIRAGEDEPDTALALFYEKQLLGPKQTRVYRTVMGMGGITVSPGDLALGLTAPATLAITDPHTYTIIAYISNTGGFSAKNAVATLRLPPGLQIVTGTSQVDVGTINPGESRQLMLSVKMSPTKASEGPHTIALTVTSDTLSDQIIERTIVFSGQPSLTVAPVGTPTIQRGNDQFVNVPIRISNNSSVSISQIRAKILPKPPLLLASFEGQTLIIPRLMPGQSQIVSWALRVSDWASGRHDITIALDSDYTKPTSIIAPVTITLGPPNAKLYYADPQTPVGKYGYIWITLTDMPSFENIQLDLVWDPAQLHAVRVSPEPWLIEQTSGNVMESFVMTDSQLRIANLKAINPPWRMIIGKWHFKALTAGSTLVHIRQGDTILDTITITLYDQ
jgi:uncharacterized repeat protein (TIGR01451 family)